MAERGADKRTRPAQLWIGPGRRAREVGAVLATLSSFAGDGDRRGEPVPVAELGDLEELLGTRASEGLLILESARLPAEDIGFVRRFLERHPAWRLVLIGEEPRDAARSLPAGRFAWLAWPPDLEELRTLVGGVPPAGAPLDRRGGGARRPRADEAAADDGLVDVNALIEELLAAAALRRDGAPRFAFQPGTVPPVRRSREALSAGLAGLLELARAAAGTDGLVRFRCGTTSEGVVVDVDFPASAARANELAAAFEERKGASAPAELAAAVAAARAGAERLRGAGARVELEAQPDARARVRVVCVEKPAPAAPARPARAGKAEDPFA